MLRGSLSFSTQVFPNKKTGKTFPKINIACLSLHRAIPSKVNVPNVNPHLPKIRAKEFKTPIFGCQEKETPTALLVFRFSPGCRTPSSRVGKRKRAQLIIESGIKETHPLHRWIGFFIVLYSAFSFPIPSTLKTMILFLIIPVIPRFHGSPPY